MAPFRGNRLDSCVGSRTKEIQGHHEVCHARCGGPRTQSRTFDANLDCAFVENALGIFTNAFAHILLPGGILVNVATKQR